MQTSNFIIHQSAKQYDWTGECFLSVKSFSNGLGRYYIKQREYLVDQNRLLILNDCTRYHLVIDTPANTESFCVFFSPQYVSDTLNQLLTCDNQLLDYKQPTCDGLHLIERCYENTGQLFYILNEGRLSSSRGMDDMEKTELFYRLFKAVLAANSITTRAADQLKFKKRQTREEIIKRVYYAKDFVDANFKNSISLKQISQVALLSENHLIRCYTMVLGCSPFQYITCKKIAEARRLITTTNKSIVEITHELGYTSLPNFSHYFKHLTGYSPSQFRKKGDL